MRTAESIANDYNDIVIIIIARDVQDTLRGIITLYYLMYFDFS